MKKLLLTFLILTFCGWTYDAVAQTADKAPYIDAGGNRIPWYLPLSDDGQTRSTVDVRFAPAEMKMVGGFTGGGRGHEVLRLFRLIRPRPGGER